MTGDSERSHCFKTENKFIVKSGCKKRMWRSLKQILTAERALPWPNDAVLCKSIVLLYLKLIALKFLTSLYHWNGT